MLLVICQLSHDVIGYEDSQSVIGAFRSVELIYETINKTLTGRMTDAKKRLLICSTDSQSYKNN